MQGRRSNNPKGNNLIRGKKFDHHIHTICLNLQQAFMLIKPLCMNTCINISQFNPQIHSVLMELIIPYSTTPISGPKREKNKNPM